MTYKCKMKYEIQILNENRNRCKDLFFMARIMNISLRTIIVFSGMQL